MKTNLSNLLYNSYTGNTDNNLDKLKYEVKSHNS